jgi:hypothetical protein
MLEVGLVVSPGNGSQEGTHGFGCPLAERAETRVGRHGLVVEGIDEGDGAGALEVGREGVAVKDTERTWGGEGGGEDSSWEFCILQEMKAHLQEQCQRVGGGR